MQRAQVVVGAARLGGQTLQCRHLGGSKELASEPTVDKLAMSSLSARARAPQPGHLGFCCVARLLSPARACLPVSQCNLGHRTFLPPLRLGTAVPLPWESRAKEMPPSRWYGRRGGGGSRRALLWVRSGPWVPTPTLSLPAPPPTQKLLRIHPVKSSPSATITISFNPMVPPISAWSWSWGPSLGGIKKGCSGEGRWGLRMPREEA